MDSSKITPFPLPFSFSETESHCLVQTGFELEIPIARIRGVQAHAFLFPELTQEPKQAQGGTVLKKRQPRERKTLISLKGRHM